MAIPHPFPYQGSKRKLAARILQYFPSQCVTLYEPFAGSAALTLAAAQQNLAEQYVINDSNTPLMQLWEKIIFETQLIADQYDTLWHEQLGNEKDFYFRVRDLFNQTHQPHYLLYLLARCVKAAIRYNANGEFNQSPDNRRKGMQPAKMRNNLERVAALLKDRVHMTSKDYRAVLNDATTNDVVYMDPPYQGVAGQNPRYAQGLPFSEFVESLESLNHREIMYLVSYDGYNELRKYGRDLPAHLNLKRYEINAGRSSQATLIGKSATTIEALYISDALWQNIRSKTLVQERFEFTKCVTLWRNRQFTIIAE